MRSTHVWRINASEIGALLGRNKYTNTFEATARVFERNCRQRWVQAKRRAGVQDPAVVGKAALRSNGAAKQAIGAAVLAATPETTQEALDSVYEAVIHAQDGVMTRARRAKVAPLAKAARDVARKIIYTEIGKRKEDSGLDAHARKTGRDVGRRNDAYYTLKGPGYVVTGMIDGYDETTATVIEHKQRQNRLFRNLPAYERIQCFIYMKMTNSTRAQLVQTFGDSQSTFEIFWDDAEWSQIDSGLVEVVANLNQLRADPDACVALANTVYPRIQ